MKYSIEITDAVVNGNKYSGYVSESGDIIRWDSTEVFNDTAEAEKLFNSEDECWLYVKKNFIEYRYVDIIKHPDDLNDLEQKRAIELYNSVGMNTDLILEDYNNDLLTINDGSDGNKYLWYMDDNYDIAINIATGEIVDAEKTQELFA